MPIPDQRDRELTRRRLGEWLATRLEHPRDVQISAVGGPAATGFSNETLLFDASWRQGRHDRREALVARVAPTAYSIFLESQFEAQYRVMKALGEHTSVPMPRTFWYEEDCSWLGAPFYVMAKIDGQVPSDNPPYTLEGWLLDADPADQERLWWNGIEAMSLVHSADWRDLGLDFLDRPQAGRPGLDQQIAYYDEYLAWAAQGRPQPVAEAAFDWVKENRPPQTRPPGLCWGDARIGNIIFSDFECRAVLDWEMVTLGPPEEDLGWWLFVDRHMHEGLGVPPIPGFPSRQATIERYGEILGRPVEDIEFHEVWAGFRFAVVMMRVAQMMVQYELIPPDSDMESNNIVTRLLAGMLDLAPPG